VLGESLTALNAGVEGLAERLVPFAASHVRVCRYEYLPNGDVASASATPQIAPLEQEANQLPRYPGAGPQSCNPPVFPLIYFVIFADNAQQVAVMDADCGSVTNGAAYVHPGTSWRNELQSYFTGSKATTTSSVGKVIGSAREVGGAPPGLNRPIPGIFTATSVSEADWQTASTATRPFSLTLPAGTYRFIFTSPVINTEGAHCRELAPVVVVPGMTTRLEVSCTYR